MAHITPRKGKRGQSWRAQIRRKGHPTVSKTFRRKRDAEDWANDAESQILRDNYFPAAEARKHTVAELIDRYVRDHLPLKPKSARRQGAQLAWWREQYGPRLLVSLTPALLTEARDRLAAVPAPSGERRSPATVNRYLAALSHPLSVASREWQWLEANPLSKVSRPKEPRGRVRFLAKEEIDRLLDACKQSKNRHLYPVVVLALATGMRKGELMGLTWTDVDFDRRCITLDETKNGELRTVPIRGFPLDVLRAHARVRHLKSPLLFPGSKLDQPIELRTPWVAALKVAEIDDFRFHDLRHTAASQLAMNGATLVEIAAVLGHKTLQMVKRYAHLSDQHTAEIVSKMTDKIFAR
jgi:integrase